MLQCAESVRPADVRRHPRSYVPKAEAQSRNLSYVNDRGDFVMRVDSTTLLAEDDMQGRKSVRIHSVDQMGDGILLAKFNWLPQGCG